MAMERSARDCPVHVRFTADERALLEQLAERDGLSLSGVLRMLLRREAATLGTGKRAPSPRRRTP